jgi:GT2 family glycosyltransferase
MEATVDVVVVAHDSGAILRDCVARVLAQASLRRLRVVDNGSRDGAVAALPADARLDVVRNEGNPGFAVACNQGAAPGDAPWILFLNPDCLLAPDTLERLLRLAAATPAVGLWGADVRDAGGRPEPAARRRDPTLARSLAQLGGLARLAGAEGLHLAPDPAQPAHPVDAVSGAFMLLRRPLYASLGGFDQGYRLHCEDLDLCRRVRAAGATVAVAEGIEVVHLKGSSSRRRPLFVTWQKARGMARYRRKFGPHGLAGVVGAAGIWARFALFAPWHAVRQALAAVRGA